MDRADIFTADRLERELERAYKDYHACADMAEKMEDENTHLVNELERVRAELEERKQLLGEIITRYDEYRERGVLPAPGAYAAMVQAIQVAREALEAKP